IALGWAGIGIGVTRSSWAKAGRARQDSRAVSAAVRKDRARDFSRIRSDSVVSGLAIPWRPRTSVGGQGKGNDSMSVPRHNLPGIGPVRRRFPMRWDPARVQDPCRGISRPFHDAFPLIRAPTRRPKSSYAGHTTWQGDPLGRDRPAAPSIQDPCMAALDARARTLIESRQADIVDAWVAGFAHSAQDGRTSSRELEAQVREFWQLFLRAIASGDTADLQGGAWEETRHFLEDLSRQRVLKGFSAAETATFVFSLKPPLFDVVEQGFAGEPQQMAARLRELSGLLDQLGLHTVKVFQKNREDVIKRQQEEMLELSTPVVKLWDGVLALPMIGTLDSQRTQVVKIGRASCRG